MPLLYRRLAGSLLYLTISRSDICCAVGLINQFTQSPGKFHLDAAKRIL